MHLASMCAWSTQAGALQATCACDSSAHNARARQACAAANRLLRPRKYKSRHHVTSHSGTHLLQTRPRRLRAASQGQRCLRCLHQLLLALLTPQKKSSAVFPREQRACAGALAAGSAQGCAPGPPRCPQLLQTRLGPPEGPPPCCLGGSNPFVKTIKLLFITTACCSVSHSGYEASDALRPGQILSKRLVGQQAINLAHLAHYCCLLAAYLPRSSWGNALRRPRGSKCP